MFGRIISIGVVIALTACTTSAQPQTPPEDFFANTPKEFRAFVETCKPWDDWDKPAPPFKVHGRTYYVGTCGIASILIMGSDGHALIDSGTELGADLILANLKKLGIDPTDVRVIFGSHEHADHVGGMAKLQEATGAPVISSEVGVEVMMSGNTHRDDPQFGLHDVMRQITHGFDIGSETANGHLTYFGITPLETHGHTPGALSWQWESCEGDQCLTIVYADSLSPVSSDDYKFSDHPAYVEAYYAGLERLGQLECDILLTPHPSHSRMLKRMRDNEMVNSGACAYYAIGKANDLEERLKREASEAE